MHRNWLEIAAIMGVAVYGAIANVFMRNLLEKRKGHDFFWYLLSNMIVAGFCGLMSYAVSGSIHADFFVSLMLAGMSGYMGGKFLELVEKQVKQKLGISDDQITQASEVNSPDKALE